MRNLSNAYASIILYVAEEGHGTDPLWNVREVHACHGSARKVGDFKRCLAKTFVEENNSGL